MRAEFNKLSGLTPVKSLPLHAQVREQLRKLALSEFADGDKFYTEPELIQRMGVAQGTVRRALGDLAREGLLERHVPKGTFVRKKPHPVFLLGVFVPEVNSEFFANALDHFVQECRSQHIRFAIYHTHKAESSVVAAQLVQNPPNEEGIVLLGNTTRMTGELTNLLKRRGYHTVNVDSLIDGYSDHYVGVDNAAGIKLGMSHLFEFGHRKINFLVNEPLAAGSVPVRIEAFQEFIADHNLTESRVHHCGTEQWEDSFDAAYAAMDAVFAGQPTAIFAVADAGAWAALKWLAERNIRVPEQVSVIGFGGESASRFMFPSLTTVAHPMKEIAKTTLELLQSTPSTPETFLLSPSLVVRDSTGPVGG